MKTHRLSLFDWFVLAAGIAGALWLLHISDGGPTDPAYPRQPTTHQQAP